MDWQKLLELGVLAAKFAEMAITQAQQIAQTQALSVEEFAAKRIELETKRDADVGAALAELRAKIGDA